MLKTLAIKEEKFLYLPTQVVCVKEYLVALQVVHTSPLVHVVQPEPHAIKKSDLFMLFCTFCCVLFICNVYSL